MRLAPPWILCLAACAALAALPLVGCAQIDCGDGTIEVDGDCVPLQAANCTGEGVRFVNGRCVPDFDDVCGPGTELNDDGTQCVSTGGPIADPRPDAGGDAPGDAPDDLPEVGDAEVGDTVEEVIDFEPECGADLDPGNLVCIWGQATNFITGAPLPGNADPPLEVQVKDLVTALGNPTAVVDETLVLPGGFFLMPSVELTGPPQQLLLIVGERQEGQTVEPAGENWQRAISGLIVTSSAVDEHGDLRLFTVPRSAVAGWNEELGLQAPLPTLETGGFLLARILDAETRLPIDGATFTYGGGSQVTIRYFADAALTTFQNEAADTTGPGGVALLRGSSATDFCNATADGFTSSGQVNCGASPGRVSIVHILMLAE